MRWHISEWAFKAVWRTVLCWVLPGEPRVLGRCRMCGRCCKEIVLYAGGKWLRTEEDFAEAKLEEPGFDRFKIVDRDDDGRVMFACTWLTEEGLCKDHENRLDLCRNHPTPSLYQSGVSLPKHCGFDLAGPACLDRLPFRKNFKTGKRFAKTLERELESGPATDGEE